MALDPSIALGVKSFAPPPVSAMEYAMNGQKMMSMQQGMLQSQQEIEQSKQQTANLAASQPGLEAQSQSLQAAAIKAKRDLAATDWLTKNKVDFTDENGNVDTARLVRKATSAGFGAEAAKEAKGDLDMASTRITNAKTQQEANIAKTEYMQKMTNYAATLLSDPALVGHPDQIQTRLKTIADTAESQVPGAGHYIMGMVGTPVMKNGQVVPQVDEQGKPILDASGKVVPQMTVQKDALAALRQATMTPKEQKEIAINQENADTARTNAATAITNATTSRMQTESAMATNFTDKDSKDPNSLFSRQEAQKAIDGGAPGVVVGKTSVFQIHNSPTTKAIVEAQAISSQAKSEALKAAIDEKNAGDQMTNAAKAAEELNIPKGTSVQSWLNSNAAKYGNDPRYRALQSQLNQYKAEHPNDNIDSMDSDALKSALAAGAIVHYNNATNHSSIVAQPTWNRAITVPGQKPAAPALAPSGVGQPNGAAAPAPPASEKTAPTTSPAKITSKAQYDSLKKGAFYYDKDGVTIKVKQ